MCAIFNQDNQFVMWILNCVISERWLFLGLNYISIHCHVVINKDLRFRLVKQLRPDTFRFIDRRFQNRVRVNGVNFNQGSMKLVRVSEKFELTEYELARFYCTVFSYFMSPIAKY